MTDLQAIQIEAQRIQGKGYKAIASAVGLSRDTVRNYCKTKGMEGYGEAVALNMQNRMVDRTDLEENSQILAGRVDA